VNLAKRRKWARGGFRSRILLREVFGGSSSARVVAGKSLWRMMWTGGKCQVACLSKIRFLVDESKESTFASGCGPLGAR
jgi:hypothetical protein